MWTFRVVDWLLDVFSKRCYPYWWHCWHYERLEQVPENASCQKDTARQAMLYQCCRCKTIRLTRTADPWM